MNASAGQRMAQERVPTPGLDVTGQEARGGGVLAGAANVTLRACLLFDDSSMCL